MHMYCMKLWPTRFACVCICPVIPVFGRVSIVRNMAESEKQIASEVQDGALYAEDKKYKAALSPSIASEDGQDVYSGINEKALLRKLDRKLLPALTLLYLLSFLDRSNGRLPQN